tara:strand:- start:521 stop:946 length:426 start_codon:yes stop_codon:yes gene_type:complete
MNTQVLKLDEFKEKLKELENPWRGMNLYEYLEDEFYSIKKVHLNFLKWQATRKLMTIQEHNTKYGWQHYEDEEDEPEYFNVLDYRGSFIEISNSQKYKKYVLTLIREWWQENEENLINLEIYLYVLWVIHETNEIDKYNNK